MTDVTSGLPEGIDFDKFAVPGDDDFEIIKYTEDHTMIHKGRRPGAAAGFLVKPKPGYTFQPLRQFDPRSYTFSDGPANTYMAVKQFDAPMSIKVVAAFAVTNEFERQIVADVLTKLNQLPGYVESAIE